MGLYKREQAMALEIKPTEVIKGKDAKRFWKEKEKIESHPGTETLEYPDIEKSVKDIISKSK